MKIKYDARFVREEFEKVGFTARDLELRWVGKECVVEDDDGMGGVLCRFSDGTRVWFPKSCVVDGSEEPMQILPDGTMAPVKTLRDEFAMAALTGLVTRSGVELTVEEIKACYEIADVVMEARKK